MLLSLLHEERPPDQAGPQEPGRDQHVWCLSSLGCRAGPAHRGVRPGLLGPPGGSAGGPPDSPGPGWRPPALPMLWSPPSSSIPSPDPNGRLLLTPKFLPLGATGNSWCHQKMPPILGLFSECPVALLALREAAVCPDPPQGCLPHALSGRGGFGLTSAVRKHFSLRPSAPATSRKVVSLCPAHTRAPSPPFSPQMSPFPAAPTMTFRESSASVSLVHILPSDPHEPPLPSSSCFRVTTGTRITSRRSASAVPPPPDSRPPRSPSPGPRPAAPAVKIDTCPPRLANSHCLGLRTSASRARVGFHSAPPRSPCTASPNARALAAQELAPSCPPLRTVPHEQANGLHHSILPSFSSKKLTTTSLPNLTSLPAICPLHQPPPKRGLGPPLPPVSSLPPLRPWVPPVPETIL